MFNRLCREYPREGADFGDPAICEFRQGSTGLAIADLLRAIELEPSVLSPYATLGAIYTLTGAKGEAIAVYDKALATNAGPEEFRRMIAASRSELTAR